MTPELNYFTCTLGQAEQWKTSGPQKKPSFNSVLDLIDTQAQEFGQRPALGFADFTKDGATLFTFADLRSLSIQAVDTLDEALGRPTPDRSGKTIGLICSSGIDFVLIWLGLMRMGYTVFLLAPQLDHKGLKHLCATTSVSTIFIDEDHFKDFQDARGDSLFVIKVPCFAHENRIVSFSNEITRKDLPQTDTAYLRHTSGTSSGLPKPISQSQLGAVGVLARLPVDDNPIATFSTTPLYHGGLADCFRAWSCGASIWFFPEGRAPITCANILKAVQAAKGTSKSVSGTEFLRYFSSVPYVLQMLSEEQDGIDMLRTMDMVGVGGAALPTVIGDKLVDSGVHLVSRMGSAECGFLLSSDRDYENDREWQFLRCAVDDPKILAFEPQDGSDLCELVAKPKWPLRNKINRDDGSFATSDLFEKHKIIRNAWRYHSRSDAQITLANGKKFDPAPLEDAIRASLGGVLQDVLVFGAGREYPGALLFSKYENDKEEDVLERAWPEIEQLNKDSSSQARLSRAALICVVPMETGHNAKKPLEKSSKGTLLRKQAEERYANLIESAYSGGSSSVESLRDVADEDLVSALQEEFQKVLGRSLNVNEDLFQQGVDSISCIQLRRRIENAFLSASSSSRRKLPLNVIYDCGNITALSGHIAKMRSGQVAGPDAVPRDDLKLMEDLAAKYSSHLMRNGHIENGRPDHDCMQTVVLTGATGLLGAHILDLLIKNKNVGRIYCLVRGQTKHVAEERIRKALALRSLVQSESDKNDIVDKLVCLPANLADAHFGLEDTDFNKLREETTLIVHGAWTVNFSLRLQSFENQIIGTRNLLDLVESSAARFCFISSTAAAGCVAGQERVGEQLTSNPRDASPIGYAQSKWVAERVCANFATEMAKKNGDFLGNRITILRIGQLCGNSKGVWNASEAFPLMLSTASFTGSLPRLPDQGLNWLPVDQAAAVVVEIALKFGIEASNPMDVNSASVFHVLNPYLKPMWHEMLDLLKGSGIGPKFDAVSPEEWLSKLQASLTSYGEECPQQHPSASLLSFWQDKFGGTDEEVNSSANTDGASAGPYYRASNRGDGQIDNNGQERDLSRFDVSRSQAMSKTMAGVQPLNQEQILQMWRWICENVGQNE